MKNIITLIIVLTAAICDLSAQKAEDIMTVRNIDITRKGDNVEISFLAETGRRAIKGKYTATVVPTIKNGNKETRLPKIIVEGRRAAVSSKRNPAGREYPAGSYRTTNEAEVNYTASVPLESLHIGDELVLEITVEGCCSAVRKEVMLVSDFVDEGVIVIEPVFREIQPTGGDLLSRKYTFIAPLSEFEEQSEANRDDFVTDNRERSLTVYFRQGTNKIDPGFRDNNRALDDLTEAITSLLEAEKRGEAKISHIIIAGFASPEGNPDINRKLAYERALALRDYLGEKTGIAPDKVDIYNGGIDWLGLRRQVELSDMDERQQLLDIIDSAKDAEDEQGLYQSLKGLNGGETYNKMLTAVFPELRSATYMRIYYENIAP